MRSNMTEKNNKLGNLDLFFKKYADVNKVPFFLLWLLGQGPENLKVESKVKRKGLPKTGPRPMVPKKQLLALLKTIEKLTLKDFAEYFGVSYGVVRLWNREPQVEEKTTEFMILFAVDYIQELEKRVFSKKLNIEKYSLKTTQKAHGLVNALLHEAKHYHPAIQHIIIDLLENKIDILPDDQANMLRVTALSLIKIMFKSDRTIFNPPKDRKAKELYEEEIKSSGELLFNFKKAIFSKFKEMIKNGETQKALKLCDYIEDQTLTMIKDNTQLSIRILNKGRQKGKDKSEKTIIPGEKKATSA